MFKEVCLNLETYSIMKIFREFSKNEEIHKKFPNCPETWEIYSQKGFLLLKKFKFISFNGFNFIVGFLTGVKSRSNYLKPKGLIIPKV